MSQNATTSMVTGIGNDLGCESGDHHSPRMMAGPVDPLAEWPLQAAR